MNPEIINNDQPGKRKRAGGGRAFHSRLEPFVEFIREQRQRRGTWNEIAAMLLADKGCPITAQGVHQFYRRYLKRQSRPHWENDLLPGNATPPATTKPTNPNRFNTDI
jgi:hypothetical protein